MFFPDNIRVYATIVGPIVTHLYEDSIYVKLFCPGLFQSSSSAKGLVIYYEEGGRRGEGILRPYFFMGNSERVAFFSRATQQQWNYFQGQLSIMINFNYF